MRAGVQSPGAERREAGGNACLRTHPLRTNPPTPPAPPPPPPAPPTPAQREAHPPRHHGRRAAAAGAYPRHPHQGERCVCVCWVLWQRGMHGGGGGCARAPRGQAETITSACATPTHPPAPACPTPTHPPTHPLTPTHRVGAWRTPTPTWPRCLRRSSRCPLLPSACWTAWAAGSRGLTTQTGRSASEGRGRVWCGAARRQRIQVWGGAGALDVVPPAAAPLLHALPAPCCIQLAPPLAAAAVVSGRVCACGRNRAAAAHQGGGSRARAVRHPTFPDRPFRFPLHPSTPPAAMAATLRAAPVACARASDAGRTAFVPAPFRGQKLQAKAVRARREISTVCKAAVRVGWGAAISMRLAPPLLRLGTRIAHDRRAREASSWVAGGWRAWRSPCWRRSPPAIALSPHPAGPARGRPCPRLFRHRGVRPGVCGHQAVAVQGGGEAAGARAARASARLPPAASSPPHPPHHPLPPPLPLPGQVRGAVLLPPRLYLCLPHRDHRLF